MKRLMAVALLVFAGFGSSPKAHATFLFETAAGPHSKSGILVNDYVWPAHRFQVDSSTRLSAVGGRFLNLGESTDIFAAIVALSGPFDFPDSIDLSTPDLLDTTLVAVGADVVHTDADLAGDDRSGALSTPLAPGWYALIFGTGRFGAPSAPGWGTVVMPTLSIDLSPAQFPFTAIQAGHPFGYVPQFMYQQVTPRFFGIPEPTSLALLGLGLAGLGFSRRRQ